MQSMPRNDPYDDLDNFFPYYFFMLEIRSDSHILETDRIKFGNPPLSLENCMK